MAQVASRTSRAHGKADVRCRRPRKRARSSSSRSRRVLDKETRAAAPTAAFRPAQRGAGRCKRSATLRRTSRRVYHSRSDHRSRGNTSCVSTCGRNTVDHSRGRMGAFSRPARTVFRTSAGVNSSPLYHEPCLYYATAWPWAAALAYHATAREWPAMETVRLLLGDLGGEVRAKRWQGGRWSAWICPSHHTAPLTPRRAAL